MPPEFDPDSLKRNCGVNFMIWRLLASAYSSRNLLILTTAGDRLSISTCPEFDPDYGVNFVIWRLLASAYSGRNLLILTTGDDLPPWVWSRFFEKKRWSQLQLHFRLPRCLVMPPKVFWASGACRKGLVICKEYFHVKLLEFKSHSKHKNLLMFV